MAGGGGGGGGSQSGGDDNALNILWMIGAIFLIGIIIWFAFETQLKFLFLKIRQGELFIINFVVQILPLDLFNLGYIKKEVSDALYIASNAAGENVSLSMAEYLSFVAGNYLRYPVIVLLLYFAYVSFFKSAVSKYTKKYNMHSLAGQERSQWPQINPVIGLDLVSEPLNDGPWAMAKSPLEFCKEYKLIDITVEEPKEFKAGGGVNFKMNLDHEKAEIVFIKQLGKLWQTPEAMPIHQRALFAVFLARGSREPKVAANLLQQINESCNSKNPRSLNFNGVDNIWRKYYNKNLIQEVIHNHAYEYTIMIDLLLLARQDGVLATADFLWLKPIDRLLWYILCSTGRQTYFSEAAGAQAHFLVEKALARPLSVPYVKEAVKALQLALDDILYVPGEDERQQLLQQHANN
jgi:intracellular multiplication protein IcmP